MSNLSAFPYIPERAEAVPALWNNIFSILSANDAALNSAQTISFPSGNTLSVFSSLDASGNLHAGNRIGVGVTPSADTVEVMTIGADSSKSDYILFHDPTGAKSSYVIGSRVGGTADGLNIYDASGSTMIASFSKQSIRFFQNVVGPVFDVGGALASTLNAATFGTGADSKESRIQAAISAATTGNIKRVYVPANMYPYSAGSISFSTMVQMVREGGDWTMYDVMAYGATGDGVVNDTSAISAAIAGGNVIAFSSLTYNLGNRAAAEVVFDVGSPKNRRFWGNGATLKMTTTDQSIPVFFRMVNPEGIHFRDLAFLDSGLDLSVNWQGARCFQFEGSGATAFYRGIILENCSATSVVTFLDCLNANPYQARVRDISLVNCRVRNAYYGINCRENGDGLRGSLRCENVSRPYFPYGVTDHTLDLSIYNDGNRAAAFAAILIKRYDVNTKNIKVAARFYGSTSLYSNAVLIEHEANPTGSGIIEDVDLDIHISEDIASPVSMIPVNFRSYTAGGVQQTSTTSNRWDRISIRGSFGSFPGDNPIVFGVQQLTEGRLYLDPSVYRVNKASPHYPGFVVRTAHDREFRTLEGNLSAQTVTIPLGGFEGTPFTLINRVYANHDSAVLGAQCATYQEDVVNGYNLGGGAVTIQDTTNLYKIVRTSDSNVTYIASGENLLVTFSGSTYTTARAYAKVETQYIGKGPLYG